MSRYRLLFAAALAAVAVVATSTATSATPDSSGSQTSGAASAGQTARSAQSGDSTEYVVGFDGSAATVQAAAQAAHGTVLDVNEDAHLALVSSTSDTFLDQVQSQSGVTGAARNHDVGTTRQGMPHMFEPERPSAADRQAAAGRPGTAAAQLPQVTPGSEPLANRQWDMSMIGATPSGAQATATGEGVDVGIIDTGIDASHPDIAPNFDATRSRNFTMDIPAIDGPCEVDSCVDPANVDDGGHGTHVSGIVAAARNHFGVGGVAPDATLVNLRAGQDSGYFFLYETVAALTEAGNLGLDVVNMSFYTDPWLYNCDSRDDYISGRRLDSEIAEQAFIRQEILAAVTYAHDHGVTLVAAAGNEHTDLAAPTRSDATSPDYPPGTERKRVVTKDCLDLPSEAPEVIGTSSVGPSTTKSDFSNYGLGEVEIAAPGGWFRDFVGTPSFQTPENEVLSSYPLHVAIEEGFADENGNPTDNFSVKYCDHGVCGFYRYLQGTSMASPHVAGVAALAISAHGQVESDGSRSLAPDTVRQILESTATDHACPAGGVEIYTDEGRPAEFNAVCQGTTALNGLYGEGIVSATGAVQ
jgi:lantibiotic leader peptide-processing serine protease